MFNNIIYKDKKMKDNKKYTIETSYSCYSTFNLAEGVVLPKPLEEAEEMWIKWDSLYVSWKGRKGIDEFQLEEDIISEIDTKRPDEFTVYHGSKEDYIDDDVIYIKEGR